MGITDAMGMAVFLGLNGAQSGPLDRVQIIVFHAKAPTFGYSGVQVGSGVPRLPSNRFQVPEKRSKCKVPGLSSGLPNGFQCAKL